MQKTKARKSHVALYLSKKSVFFSLLGVALGFCVVHIFTQWLVYKKIVQGDSFLFSAIERLDVSLEVSIPTWYSQTILFLAAALSLFMAFTQKGLRNHYSSWLIISACLLYMSADEGAELHELSRRPMDSLGVNSGIFASSWVIPWLAVVIAIGALLLRFWLSLPQPTKALFFLAAAIFVSGAVGLEMLGSLLYEHHNGDMSATFLFQILFAVEELMEMAGVTIFIYALLDYVDRQSIQDAISLKFKS